MSWVLAIAGLVLAVLAIRLFNALVGLENRAKGAWSDIDVQLERRHDLVENLVETVKGYARHERAALEEVARARARAEQVRSTARPRAAGDAENDLAGGIRTLFALAEAYPDLKASERFLDLQRALTDVEDHIQNARRYYNAVVRDLNTRSQSFPGLLIARPLGFREREFFQLDAAEDAATPRVSMGDPR